MWRFHRLVSVKHMRWASASRKAMSKSTRFTTKTAELCWFSVHTHTHTHTHTQVYASPALRTQRTAAIATLGIYTGNVVISPDIVELGQGAWETQDRKFVCAAPTLLPLHSFLR